MRTAGGEGHALHLLMELLPVLDGTEGNNHSLPGLLGPVGAVGGGLHAGSWDGQGPVGGLAAAPEGTLCCHYLTDAWGMSSEAASVLQQPHGVLGEANEAIHVGWGPRTCILYSLTQ